MSPHRLARLFTPVLFGLCGCQLSLRAPCLQLEVAFCKDILCAPHDRPLVHVDGIQPVETPPEPSQTAPPPEQKNKKFARVAPTDAAPVLMFPAHGVGSSASSEFVTMPHTNAGNSLLAPQVVHSPAQGIQKARDVAAVRQQAQPQHGRFVVVPNTNLPSGGGASYSDPHAPRWTPDPSIRYDALTPSSPHGIQWAP